MKTILHNAFWKFTVSVLLMVSFGNLQSQTTIFTENMGTPSGTTAISANAFQNSGTLTYSGTADVRNTTVSSGYTGASGGGNIFITTTNLPTFQIAGVNTSSYTNLILSFGHFKSSTTGNNELVVEVSSDGTNYTALTYTRPTGTGTSTWILVTPTGSIPSTSNLRIRFRQTSSTTQFRIDDVKLTGSVVVAAPSVTTNAATGITSSGATLNGSINANSLTANATFEYGTSLSYGSSVAASPATVTGTTSTPVSATISGLSVNTQYNFRAVGTVSGAPTNGSNQAFYTLANVPGAALVNNATTSTLDVTINSTTQNGNPSPTQYAIQESSGKYIQSDGSLNTSPFWQTAALWGTKTVNSLNSNTAYSFSVKARNGDNVETVFGDSASGTTLQNLSATITLTSSLPAFGNICINSTSVQSFTIDGSNLDGTPLGISTVQGYAFSTSASGPFQNPLSVSYGGSTITGQVIYVQFAPTASQSYSSSIVISGGGLSPSNSFSVSGSGISTSVVAATTSASAVTSTSASLGGTLTLGCFSLVQYGIEYSTVNNFAAGTGTIVLATNLSGNAFSSLATNLLPNTTYYYRAFATDNSATSFATLASFTTANLSAPVATAATAISQGNFTANWNPVTGATGYRLDVSTSATFTSTVNTTDLFFSEYLEGSSSNKYIEIYNGTGASVNLSNYELRLFANGTSTPTSTVVLSGTLANGATIVYKNSAATIYAGATNNSAVNYNGDDAIALWKVSSSAYVDIFGRIGEDPGTAWTSGSITTLDKTLVRNPNVLSGITANPASGFPTLSTEWIQSNIDTVSNLGAHTINNSSPSFVSGYQNLSVNGTSAIVSGLSENTNYYYRVRAVSSSSTSSNSNTISVLTAPALPTFGAIAQVVATVCEDTAATFNVTGLLPNSTSTISYNINGGATQTAVGVTSNPSGFATFEVVLPLSANGQVLTVTAVERTDLASGSITVTNNNTVILNVSANVTYYADTDGDGYGNPSSTTVSCEGVPVGYAINGTDCNDNNAAVYQSATLYVDADVDGYNNGTSVVCYGASVPAGYSASTLGTDCNDNDAAIHATFSFYADADHDSYGTGSLVSVCAVDANTPPTGYSLNNTDCNDNNAAVYQSGTLYVDADNDGYTTGVSAVVCYGATVPSGYAATNIGIDCNDAVAAINPGHVEVLYNGVDDNCNGVLDEGFQITSQVQAAQCGTTLTSISSLINAVSLPQITYYRFEVTNTETNAVQVIDKPLQFFALTELTSYTYGTTYSIRVQVQRNGIWLGYYGSACQVSSPAVTSTSSGSTLPGTQCGSTLTSINQLISTTSLAGATAYRFRITNVTDLTAPNQVQILDRPLQWFNLPMLTTYNYGTSYMIEVSVKTNGVYSGYGAPCTVTAPPVPSLAQCGGAIATPGTLIYTTSLLKVTSYRFEITNLTTNQVITIDRPLHWFSFNNIPGYSPSTQYGVRIAVMTSGVYSQFSDACEITSPGTARAIEVASPAKPVTFTATAYPNPFADNVRINVSTSSEASIGIKVYDMTGRLLETREVEASQMETLEVGDRYPSGVYNVIVNQGDVVKTLRVVKR